MPATLAAQEFQMSGRALVVHESDTIPLENEWISLHQISFAGGSVVDSARTDPIGVYVLRAAQRDTSALYISSIQYNDVTYFSTPVRSLQFNADTASTLLVYDTSSVGAPLALTQRHVVVREPNEDGARPVLELAVIENRSNVTRIAGDQLNPVWQTSLPEGAFGFQVGESDISPEALSRDGDVLSLVAPVPPGPKQIVFSYSLPRTTALSVPVSQTTERLQLLLEDTTATVSGQLALVGTEQLEDLRFVRYENSFVPAGSIRVNFPSQPFVVTDYWWIVVVAAGLAFAGVIMTWSRRVKPVPVSSDDPDVLAARIAMLDENFERVRDTVTDGDRTEYENARADLKARLSTALARREYDR